MEAMFHPEMLSLFCSMVGLHYAVKMIVHRAFTFRLAAAAGVGLGAAQLVRTNTLWIFGAVVTTLLVLALRDRASWRPVVKAAALVTAVTFVVSGPWYLRQTIEFSSPVPLQRQPPATPLWDRRPASFYIGTGLPEVMTNPVRPNFVNESVPTVYSDLWGDYFGYFAWTTNEGTAAPAPETSAVRRQLVLQQLVGLLPSILSVLGIGLLIYQVTRRRALAAHPERLLVVLVAVLGLLGFLYFSVKYPSGDGDVLKAAYLLTTAPAWAIGFAVAFDRLIRGRLLTLAACAVFAVGGLLDVAFIAYHGPAAPGF